jgi:DNA helicase MCM9
MVGDPGTAKSQFLRYAAKVSPRSVLTTGIGTTSAGLTVTAVREPGTGEWMFDAGALVLADGGICCIDEFDGIREHDRGAIHEAMEQQTLSVAKAGLVCTLDTRATVIAAVNPKCGKICTEIGSGDTISGTRGGSRPGCDDSALPITVGIASPLLSRFDVVLTLLDQRNEDWDRQLSSFILNGYKDASSSGKSGNAASDAEAWPVVKLQQYVAYIKSNIKPRLSHQAQRVLTKYYTMERTATGRNAARTTVRLLEALVRLTQAHARIMFRETATAMDAVFAVAAVEASAAAQQVVGGMGALHAQFPEDPDTDFQHYASFILMKLGLEDEVDVLAEDDAPV